MATTLEKLRYLEQYLAAGSAEGDLVLDRTVDKLLAREVGRMAELRARLLGQLTEFETRYTMRSDEFCRRYEAGELGDGVDFVEWAATLDMLRSIEKPQTLLEQASRQ
jgi:hypothetical protein